MAKNIYRGYSSYEYQNNKTFKITDLDLVKLDLLNNIFTRRGERVMMPLYGTRIPDLAFEPLDEITLDIVREDLRQVVTDDPRVEMIQMVITPSYDTNSLVASMKLYYIELNLVDDMDINLTFEGA